MIRRVFLKSILPCLLISSALAQVPVDQLSVTGVTASLDKPTVKAGDTVQLNLKFNAPFTRRTTVFADFQLNNPRFDFAGNVDIPENQQETRIPIKVNSQADAGDYVLSGVIFTSEKRQPIIQVNPPLVLHVLALPDHTVLPTAVTATIELTKRQSILSQATSLEAIRNTLATQIDGHASVTSAVLQNLLDACQKADQIILASQTIYLKGWTGDARLKPVFFDDFHQRFLADIVMLREQQRVLSRRTDLTPMLSSPQLIRVQSVKQRPNDNAQDWKAPMLSGTFPFEAQAVFDLLGEAISAFRRVSDTGDTFLLTLKSTPSGASVSFMRVGTSFEPWPAKTDTKVEFPLARYTFRFIMDGCPPQDIPLDPYLMADAELNPEFKSCKK
jgi:hypothetical protein